MAPILLVITGAASGIGLQLARHFVSHQLPLILLDNQKEKLLEHFQEAKNVQLVVGDASKEATWQEVI